MQGYQSLGTVLCETGLRMGWSAECPGCPACGLGCASLSSSISGQVDVGQPWILTSWC